MISKTNKPRLLVTEYHHLGDAVLSFPFLLAAAKCYEVHVSCRPSVRDVFLMLLPENQIHTWEPPWHEDCKTKGCKKTLQSTHAVINRWRQMNFSVATSAWSDPRVHYLWAKARIPRRIGFPATRLNHYGSHLPGRARRLQLAECLAPLLRFLTHGRSLLTDQLHKTPENPHQLAAWKHISAVLELSWNEETPWIACAPARDIPPPLQHAKAAGKKIFLAHTGGRLPTKIWPESYWATTLHSLRDRLSKWQFFTICGSEDSSFAGVPDVIKLQPTPQISQLANVLQQADFVLAHDSFPAHLAYAVGTQVLAIFGSGDPAWFAPGGKLSNAVFVNECNWRPCLDVCRMPSTICLEGLHPNAVINATLAAIK